MPQNEEDISYMFDDETTPVKACGDLAYHIGHDGTLVPFLFFLFLFNNVLLIKFSLSVQTAKSAFGFWFFNTGKWVSDNMSKGTEECRESFSQMKRRRMLQFPNKDMDSSLCSEEMSSAFLKSNVSFSLFSKLSN